MVDKDFIYLKKYGYSLKQFLLRHPEGAPDNLISKALCLPEKDVEKIYRNAIAKLKKFMQSEEHEDEILPRP